MIRARERGSVPSQIGPRVGLNIQFKSSEDLKEAVKPRPSERAGVWLRVWGGLGVYGGAGCVFQLI